MLCGHHPQAGSGHLTDRHLLLSLWSPEPEMRLHPSFVSSWALLQPCSPLAASPDGVFLEHVSAVPRQRQLWDVGLLSQNLGW